MRILILLISTLIPFSLHGMDNDSLIVPDQEQAVIYVHGDVEVYGLSSISNAVVKRSNSSNPGLKHTVKKKQSDSSIATKIAEKENLKKKALQQLQNKINKEISHFYYTDSNGNDLFSAKMLKLNSEATNVLVNSQHIKAIAAANDLLVFNAWLYLTKQKFFTSLSYLQFGKLRNSFLRGPPIV